MKERNIRKKENFILVTDILGNKALEIIDQFPKDLTFHIVLHSV
jgi:hypothetical protein